MREGDGGLGLGHVRLHFVPDAALQIADMVRQSNDGAADEQLKDSGTD